MHRQKISNSKNHLAAVDTSMHLSEPISLGTKEWKRRGGSEESDSEEPQFLSSRYLWTVKSIYKLAVKRSENHLRCVLISAF